MMKRNIKSKLSTERHIRQHLRKQQQQPGYDEELGGTIISPIVGEGYIEERQERPSFRKNLTGKDNVERLSNMMTRPSLTSAANPSGTGNSLYTAPRPSVTTVSSHPTDAHSEDGRSIVSNSQQDETSYQSVSIASSVIHEEEIRKDEK